MAPEKSTEKSASLCPQFFSSSIGRKIIMGVTGIMLFGFIIAHLLGNLKIFAGAGSLNEYAEFLEELGPILWVMRIGLIVVFIAHIVTAIQLTLENKAARPTAYKEKEFTFASIPSRYMAHAGMVILIFVIIHLLHFTFKTLHPEFETFHDANGHEDVYRMVIVGFSDPRYAGFYILALLCLGAHLSHGIQSFFQTLGFYHETFTPLIRLASPAIGWTIALAYIAIPVSVLLGVIQ